MLACAGRYRFRREAVTRLAKFAQGVPWLLCARLAQECQVGQVKSAEKAKNSGFLQGYGRAGQNAAALSVVVFIK